MPRATFRRKRHLWGRLNGHHVFPTQDRNPRWGLTPIQLCSISFRDRGQQHVGLTRWGLGNLGDVSYRTLIAQFADMLVSQSGEISVGSRRCVEPILFG